MKTQLVPFSLSRLREPAQQWAAMIERVFYQPHPVSSRISPDSHAVHLEKGEVLSLTKECSWHSVTVRSGLIWLTETPAATDHVLHSGADFTVKNNLPVVIQALEDATVVLA